MHVCLHTYRPHVHTPYDMYYHGDNSGLTQLQQQHNSSMNSTQSTSYFLYLTLWKAEPEQLYLQAAANLWLLAAPLPAQRGLH